MPRARALLAGALLALAWGCGGDAGEELTEEERTRRVLEARTEGEALLQQDRVDEAREAFSRLVEMAPEEATGYASLALVHLRAGELDEAERLARQALERAPDDAALHGVLARVLEERGDAAGARRALGRAVELAPGSLEAHYALSEFHAPDGPLPDTSARLTHLGRVVEAAPANEAGRAELALALLESGRADSAAAHLEALRAQLPELPDDVTAPLEEAIAAGAAGRPGPALQAARRFADHFRVTQTYQAAAQDLRGPRGTMSGFPALRFSHELTLQAREQGAVYDALRFAEATAAAGLAGPAGASPGGDAAPGGPGAADGAAAGAVVAPGDFDADDDRDLFVAEPADGGSRVRLLRSDLGRFVDVTAESGLAEAIGAQAPAPGGEAAAGGGPGGVPAGGDVWDARFGDLDNDGFLDLWIVRSGRDLYLRNRGDGTFEDATDAAGIGGGEGRAVVFADLDTDGDLDVFVAGAGPDRLWRNDGEGTFTELGAAWGLAGDPAAEGRDVDFADLDDDGDMDLVVANAGAPSALHTNLRGGRFEERAEGAGLARAAHVVEAGDVDNDGRVDLLLAGPAREAGGAGGGRPPGGATLYANRGGLRFEPADALPQAAGPPPADAAFLDFDNDGHRDLILVGAPGESAPDGRAARLLHNRGDGTFEPASDKLPSGWAAAPPRAGPGAEALPPAPSGGFARVAVADYNEDGDADLLLAGRRGGFRLWRNDGGDANHHVRLELTGLARGNGKVNRNGIGSRVELRAGDLYQVATVRDPVTIFGLGHRLKADVIRIEWTNGVPQSLYYPGTDEDLREEQTLKGSCAFLYAWDGDGFEMVTDVVWKSAIGMPVGIMGASGPAGVAGGSPSPGRPGAPSPGDAPAAPASRRIHAPPAASREYVRVPGDALRADDGTYRIRLTEELWETAYLDEVKLLALDHPDSVEVFVDERFVPPGPPALRIYRVARRHLPVGARDGRGNDLLPALRAADDVHVSNLVPGRWQGTTRMHDLVLDLGEAARTDSVFLFLQGWVFPTDASINVAMAQAGVRPRPPVLQVRDGAGEWVTVRPHLSFPSGKEKTVVADLTGAWRSASREVRIRTELEVYWDHAFFAVGSGVAGPLARASAEELVVGGAAEARVREAAARGVRRLAAAEGGTTPAVDGAAAPRPPAPGVGGGPDVAPAARAAYGDRGSAADGLRLTVLRPVRADLRVRGFSRTYRKGGRHGPHWFDYDDVSARSPWLPIDGRFTRTGEVGPLLLAADDLYAILAPGDEAAVEFSSAAAPEPPPGWTRDFLVYTVGWIKDADRNTAEGDRVDPLPWHGMSAYPPPEAERDAFPGDGLTGLWDRALNTRRAPAPDPGSSAPAPGG